MVNVVLTIHCLLLTYEYHFCELQDINSQSILLYIISSRYKKNLKHSQLLLRQVVFSVSVATRYAAAADVSFCEAAAPVASRLK